MDWLIFKLVTVIEKINCLIKGHQYTVWYEPNMSLRMRGTSDEGDRFLERFCTRCSKIFRKDLYD